MSSWDADLICLMMILFHGHTHFSHAPIHIGKCIVCSNQRGYPMESNGGFKNDIDPIIPT